MQSVPYLKKSKRYWLIFATFGSELLQRISVMKFVNSDLTVLPKVNSLSDAFNSSQLKVVHMGAYQIEETAFLTYIWATRVLSQINSPVTCTKGKIPVPTMSTIKETYGTNRYLFINKAYLQSPLPMENFY